MMIIKVMAEITFVSVLQKIRSICKECDMLQMPERVSREEGVQNLQVYVRTLQSIRGQLIRYRQLEEEYWRLQNALQKMECDLRKKIGFEQQMRLYNDALKGQVEELAMEKLELLENSKEIIRQLKRTNEELFADLKGKGNSGQGRQNKSNHNEERGIKTDRTRTLEKGSGSVNIQFKRKEGGEEQFRDIVKTEQIERNRTGKVQSGSRKHKMRLFASDQNLQTDLFNQTKVRQMSDTFNIAEKTERELGTNSKRKYHKNLYSNLLVPKYTKRQQEKDLKNIYLAKSPEVGQRQGKQRQGKERQRQSKRVKPKLKTVGRSVWKERLFNRSVMSAGSMQPAISNKQTL